MGQAKRNITHVSGGQLQRAGICRALMGNQRIIFGDDPTGALNTKAAQEIMDLFISINSEGTAVVLVTHHAKVTARAQRVLFMCDGKIESEMNLPKYIGTDIESRAEKLQRKCAYWEYKLGASANHTLCAFYLCSVRC